MPPYLLQNKRHAPPALHAFWRHGKSVYWILWLKCTKTCARSFFRFRSWKLIISNSQFGLFSSSKDSFTLANKALRADLLRSASLCRASKTHKRCRSKQTKHEVISSWKENKYNDQDDQTIVCKNSLIFDEFSVIDVMILEEYQRTVQPKNNKLLNLTNILQ